MTSNHFVYNTSTVHAYQMRLPLDGDTIIASMDERKNISSIDMRCSPRVAEFFAGIGLVRAALEYAGFHIVFANDIEPVKWELYAANFDTTDFVLGDIRNIHGHQLPDVDVATASFPCTDLSLAGGRRGLNGKQSSMFWEFARVLEEMGGRRPAFVMLENVPSFATSRDGADLSAALARLNTLDYWCDLFVVDACFFVPQSRPRLFIIGALEPACQSSDWEPSTLRPAYIQRFVLRHPTLRLNAFALTAPQHDVSTLATVIERFSPDDGRWWDAERLARFLSSLSPRQSQRLEHLRSSAVLQWATAYRRTRHGAAVWEIRGDAISGCLRTARGGSSKQAIVEAGQHEVRVRWMTPREYARLQGAPDYRLPIETSENQALFGFGDAVCVPVVQWVAETYLRPLLGQRMMSGHGRAAVSEMRWVWTLLCQPTPHRVIWCQACLRAASKARYRRNQEGRKRAYGRKRLDDLSSLPEEVRTRRETVAPRQPRNIAGTCAYSEADQDKEPFGE